METVVNEKRNGNIPSVRRVETEISVDQDVPTEVMDHSLDLEDDEDYLYDMDDTDPLITTKSPDIGTIKESPAGSSLDSRPASLPGAIEDFDDEPIGRNEDKLNSNHQSRESSSHEGVIDHENNNDALSHIDEENEDELYHDTSEQILKPKAFDTPNHTSTNLHKPIAVDDFAPKVTNDKRNSDAEFQQALVEQINKPDKEDDIDYNDPFVKTILGSPEDQFEERAYMASRSHSMETSSPFRYSEDPMTLLLLEHSKEVASTSSLPTPREARPVEKVGYPHQTRTSMLRQKLGARAHAKIMAQDHFFQMFHNRLGEPAAMPDSKSRSIPGSPERHQDLEMYPLHHVKSDTLRPVNRVEETTSFAKGSTKQLNISGRSSVANSKSSSPSKSPGKTIKVRGKVYYPPGLLPPPTKEADLSGSPSPDRNRKSSKSPEKHKSNVNRSVGGLHPSKSGDVSQSRRKPNSTHVPHNVQTEAVLLGAKEKLEASRKSRDLDKDGWPKASFSPKLDHKKAKSTSNVPTETKHKPKASPSNVRKNPPVSPKRITLDAKPPIAKSIAKSKSVEVVSDSAKPPYSRSKSQEVPRYSSDVQDKQPESLNKAPNVIRKSNTKIHPRVHSLVPKENKSPKPSPERPRKNSNTAHKTDDKHKKEDASAFHSGHQSRKSLVPKHDQSHEATVHKQKTHKSLDGRHEKPSKTSPSVVRKNVPLKPVAHHGSSPAANQRQPKFSSKNQKLSKELKQKSFEVQSSVNKSSNLTKSKSRSDEDIAKAVEEIEKETIELDPAPTGFISSSKKFFANILQRKSADSTRGQSNDDNSEKEAIKKEDNKVNHDSGLATEESGTPASSAGSVAKSPAKIGSVDDKKHPDDKVHKKQDSAHSKLGEHKTEKKDENDDEEGDEDEDEEEDDGKGNKGREDVSTKLLRLCKKGEWTLVESLLRTTKKRKLNLSMVDENGLTPLMFAVKDSRVSVVEKLLELGGDLDETTKDGRTSAHIAAMYAKEDMMRFLISKRVDLKQPAGVKEQSPLHMACNRPNNIALPLVQLLLKASTAAGDEPRLIQDKNGCTPLLLACEVGNLAVCKELLAHLGTQQTKARRKDNGDAVLHVAVRSKNLDLIKLLGEYGASANVQNENGQTPLHIVAAEGQENMLRIFYNLKADANISDKDEKTPLHVAAEKGYTSIVEILADKFKASVLARTKDGSTLMHIASKFGHSDTALAFLKRGVPLHMPNKSGALGLHLAAALGHVPVVKALLSKGTPVDSRTKDNYTPLHVAVQAEKPEVVETLLGHGADVSVRGGKLGETALHVAAGLKTPGGRHCADMLLKSGAEVNLKLENGETALHIACKTGNVPMVKLLLSEGADPMATSKIGDSPLHIAARHCHHEPAKILLDHIERNKRREDCTTLTNSQTTDGETPMHLVAENTKDECSYVGEDVDLVHLLVDYGGEVNVQTINTGETVLHYSARSGNEEVLAAIVKKIGPGAVQIALNRQDKSGWSPLMEACDKGHVAAVKILLQHHARVDVFDETGKTALHLACENGHTEISDLLLKHKAFINSKTKLGITPLHLASMNGHNKVVSLLVQVHKALADAVTLENRTPLHLAAQFGQLSVCSTLLTMGANANAHDTRGQTPLHLAAESDHPDVVKLFLKLKPDLSTLMATDENGLTCAHIAAMKGSVAVVKELMMIDKKMVTEAKTTNTEQTALHMAASGGHKNVVRILLAAGANPLDENNSGMTPLQLAARFGHSQTLEVFETEIWDRCSRKTGLSAIQVAAYYGQMECVRTLLSHVSATARSEPPISFNPLIIKELNTEYGLTPLHMAAQSGHEGLVRLLLNFAGVQVDAATVLMAVIPLHLAAQSGHIAVVGMLLSRSTQQLHIKDSKGRTALHLAASQGHYEMVSLLIAQGSNINVLDQQGWTALHFATKAGHASVVKLLIDSGADPLAETREGKVALCFAAAHSHMNALVYLMHQSHDTHGLMDDRKFIFDIMTCGKNMNNKAVEEFIVVSPAPIETAVKLSSIYKMMATKEKERARDLFNISEFCEAMAVELLALAAQTHNPALLLKAQDSRGRPFIDVLIENEQKAVVSHASVQRYLTEVWSGGIHWGLGKFALFFLLVFFCPPAWIFFSLPFSFRVSEAPIIKFICHLVSHIYFTILLVMETLCMVQYIYEINSPWPKLNDWLLLLWLSGMLVAELSTLGGRSGLGFVRLIEIMLSAGGVLLHAAAFIYPYYVADWDPTIYPTGEAIAAGELKSQQSLIYLRNQMFAFTLLFGFVQYLEFLTVHHLFGPWAIIIRDLMYDLARFLVILFLFMAGFTLHISSIFQPAFAPIEDDQSKDLMKLGSPAETIQMLYFALFGLVDPTNMPPLHLVPESGQTLLKTVFGIYLMVIIIVLINLLIAMMSDTYQRIQAQSDVEWKFGRAKLIRQMNKKSATPPPINMFTKFFMLLRVAYNNRCNMCTTKAQEDLRYIENIDAYSMSEQAGRISPNAKMMNSRVSQGDIFGNAELGSSSEWKIENVINWKHVVEQFYIYQGGGPIDLDAAAKHAEGDGQKGAVHSKDETQKVDSH